MASILCIETSTEVCSVALAVGGKVSALLEDKNGKNHALLLTRFIEEVMATNKLEYHDLDAVAVSGGPGSYTGLRIGVSTAKGLCYAAGIPLISIPTLESMAHFVSHTANVPGIVKKEALLYCPMIDARRMEVYAAIFNNKLAIVRDIRAEVIDHLSFMDFLQDHKVLFFGNGAEKCKLTIQHPNALFLDHVTTSASHMTGLAEASCLKGQFADVAYYEPFYLKDFVATIPTKNVFLRHEKYSGSPSRDEKVSRLRAE